MITQYDSVVRPQARWSGEFSRRSHGYYGEVGAALHKIAKLFYNLAAFFVATDSLTFEEDCVIHHSLNV